MLKEGRRNPKALSMDGAKYFIQNPTRAREDWIIYEYPSELKAQQVRDLIKLNSPKIKIILKNKKLLKQRKKTPLEQIIEIDKKNHPDYLVRYIDADGYKYNFKRGSNDFRRSTGIALESIKSYSLNSLLNKGNLLVLVHEWRTIPDARGSGAYRVEGRIIKKIIINKE